jgi:DNA repair protein RecN (Recombination protein N)
MLSALSIRDIVLIDRLDLAFGPGLSVLTGETGAGKSILLDSLSLALGGRGDGGLVRHGQAQGQVTAVFDVSSNHPAHAMAREQGVEGEGELILRRVQMSDGRTRAFLNDQPISVQMLRQLGATLVEIHGQHDDRALIDPASHRGILDAFGQLQMQAQRVAAASAALSQARSALAAHRKHVETARAEADYLRHAAAELDKLAPELGEEEALANRRQSMMQAEKVVTELNEACEMLSGQASPIPVLSSLTRRLERRAGQAPELLDPPAKALDAAIVALEEARDVLERSLREAQFDPQELERVEERLFALRGAARKYNVLTDDLAALAARFEADLAALDAGESQLKQLDAAVRVCDADYVSAAALLSDMREKTAQALDAAVMQELPPLKLERASFLTRVERDETLRGPGSRPIPVPSQGR